MKVFAIITVLLATGTVAAPYAEAAPNMEARSTSVEDLESFLHDIELTTNVTLLDGSGHLGSGDEESVIGKRQTQAGCYGACDAGRAALRAICAILPPTPHKVACFAAATALGSPGGNWVCRRFCNIFP